MNPPNPRSPASSPTVGSLRPLDRLLPPAVLPGKHWMELILTFRDGTDRPARAAIGSATFRIKGHYQVEDGKCWWTKSYVKKHSIAYQGYNEGKGIWGTWEYEADLEGRLLHLARRDGRPDPVPPGRVDRGADRRLGGRGPATEPAGAPAEVGEPATCRPGLARLAADPALAERWSVL